MAKSEAPNGSWCFSGIIRGMLCTGNVPTHPSDHIPDSKTTTVDMNKPQKHENKPEIQAQPVSPSIVAKLMGLDSLPADTNWAPKGRTPDSFSRSRSVNFADYLLNFDLNDQSQSPSHHQQRRVRTSVSFREVPASFQQQKRDFLVVYLDDNSEETRKWELGLGEAKLEKKKEKSKSRESRREHQTTSLKKENERTDSKISRLKNEPTKKACKQDGTEVLGSVLPRKKKEQNNGGVRLKVLKQKNQKKAPEKFTIKRKNQQASKKIRPIESGPENLSAVSLLDEVYNLHSEGHSRSMKWDMKREFESNICNSDRLKVRRVMEKDHGKAERGDMAEYVTALGEQLRRLAEEDLGQTHWISSRANKMLDFEGLEDICVEFESHILHVLLDEVTSEIVDILS